MNVAAWRSLPRYSYHFSPACTWYRKLFAFPKRKTIDEPYWERTRQKEEEKKKMETDYFSTCFVFQWLSMFIYFSTLNKSTRFYSQCTLFQASLFQMFAFPISHLVDIFGSRFIFVFPHFIASTIFIFASKMCITTAAHPRHSDAFMWMAKKLLKWTSLSTGFFWRNPIYRWPKTQFS